MAGLQELGKSLERHSESSDEGEEMVIWDKNRRHTQSNGDDPALDIGYSELPHHGSFKRYSPSLRHFMPVRPFASDDVTRIDQAGCLSFITYSWVFSYLWSAFKGFIPRDPTWSISIYDSTSVNMARLEFLWKEELKHARGPPSLFRVVRRFYRTRLLLACFIFFFCLAFGFIGPTCLVRALISHVESVDKQLVSGIILVVVLLIVEVCRVLSYGATWAVSYRSGIRLRSAVLGLLFKKLMNLRSLKRKTAAEIVNIYANDGQRIFDAATFAPLVLMGPFVLIGGIIYLIALIGPWSLLGLAVFLFFDVVQVGLGKTMVKYRRNAIEKTEERVSLMGELLRCIRIIKMNAWENSFMDKIHDVRHKEKVYLRTAGFAQSLAIECGAVVPVFATIVTFLAVISSRNDLLASENQPITFADYAFFVSVRRLLPSPLLLRQAFSAITVYFVMLFGVRMIPYGARYFAEAVVALRNIQELLLLNEADLIRPPPVNKQLALVIQDAVFAWESSAADKETNKVTLLEANSKPNATLKGINLVLEKKQLVGICGGVGAGKTALLNAIIGQMVQQDGNISVNGTLAYASQQPWIQNLTFRENILFGEPFDEQRYYRVLYSCSLNQDVNSLPANDQTEIGERGVTLSGGQRVRLSLARALFSNRDIYLLDDVTSALDQSVCEHVFNYAIKGMLVGKSTLMVTSNVEHLELCDEVVFMENGRILDQGPHNELFRRCKEYAAFCDVAIKIYAEKPQPIENLLGDEEFVDNPTPIGPKPSLSELSLMRKKQEIMDYSETNLTGSASLVDIPSAVSGLAEFWLFGDREKDSQMTEQEEDLGLASLSWRIYCRFVGSAGGLLVVSLVLLMFVINVASAVFATAWLSHWLTTVHNFNQSDSNSNCSSHLLKECYFGYYSTVYLISLALLTITGIIKAYAFVKVSLNASSRLHNGMFGKVIRGSMKFFDTTPTGRILNRFSKDMDEIDVKMPFTLESFLQNALFVIAYLVVIAYVFPWFLVACIPIGLVFGLFVACFRAGIRSLKRSENVSRSPMFDHITASLDGLATIHAYGQTKRFVDMLKRLLDTNSASMFMFNSAMRWLAVWLDLIVVTITVTTAFLIVTKAANIDPALAGMALAFAIQMSGIFQFSVRLQTELEAKMTSVERVNYYIEHIDQEDSWISQEFTPPLDWPARGRISFRDVKMRYRDNFPLALKGISFDVRPKEKIGIVGRTGSGKSSIGAALFRLYHLFSGTVSLDEIDISKVGLHELRRVMEAIPQDPVLFAGSVRFNLDPNRRHTDTQLWQALERTHMKAMVSSMDGKLDAEIHEGGRNLSIGERQLLCMARALLRNVRILLLDEATSSLNTGMDEIIQQCLREEFKDCTLLIIAHRLTSVMHCDKILFMDSGKMLEFDHPKVLMEDPKSRFYQMVMRSEDSGEASATTTPVINSVSL